MLKSRSLLLSKYLNFLFVFLFLLSSYAHNPLHTNTNINLKHDLVYKNCGNNTLADSTNSPQQIFSTLFNELLQQSSKTKFFQTNTGDESTIISALYQCRNDLSQEECQKCIKQNRKFSEALCGTKIPSRIHLSGCYIHYKQEGYESSKLEVQHKKCGEEGSLGSLGEVRERALEGVGDCVIEGEGYCDMRYEGIHVLAQCEGDMARCECGGCIGNAEEILRGECKYSISGEVYLDGCFVIYRYEDENSGYSNRDYETRRNNNSSGKVVAIAVGGVALLFLGAMLLYCCRSSRSKSDEW